MTATDQRLSDVELEAMLARAEAACAGFHVIEPTDDAPSWGISNGYTMWWPEECVSKQQDEADARFFAGAPDDVPHLIQELRAARAALRGLVSACDEAEWIAGVGIEAALDQARAALPDDS